MDDPSAPQSAPSSVSLGSVVESVQHGRSDEVKFAVKEDGKDRTGLSANASDADGCTLMHWACINNRLEIVKHLLKCGADVNAIGGVLKEVPLQWAARNEGYGFTHLVALLLENGADVRHKSILGQDALFLAVMAGNANVVFMLLSIGEADVNTMDSRGLTPLLWMCRKRKLAGQGNAELIRLLLSFGADPTLADAPPNLPSGVMQNDDGGDGSYGNNCMHYIAEVGKSYVDDYLLQEIVRKSKPELLTALNNLGNTPRKVAELNRSDKIHVFLRHWDAYNALPKPFVIWSTAGLIVGVYFILSLTSLWNAAPIIIVIGVAYERYGMQHAIALDSSRLPHGFAWGVIFTTYTACVRYLGEDGGVLQGTSEAARWATFIVLTILEGMICHALYTTSITNPNRLEKRPAQEVVAGLKTQTTFAPLLHRAASSPPRGAGSVGVASHRYNEGGVDVGVASAALMRTVVEYGPLNGPESEASVTKAVRARAEADGVSAPARVKVCATCLLDRNVLPLPKGLLTGSDDLPPGVERSEEGILTGPDTPIAYATHCGQCNACVLNLDHHCGFVNNCVGHGNRRIFVWFCLTAGTGCLLASALMFFKMMGNNPQCRHTHASPAGEQGSFAHKLGVVDFMYTILCMLVRRTEVLAAALLAFLVGIWIFAIFFQQVALVASKSTTVLAMQADKDYWRGGSKEDIVTGEDGAEYFDTSAGGSGQGASGMMQSLVKFVSQGTYEVVKRPVLRPVLLAKGNHDAKCCDNHHHHHHNHHQHSSGAAAGCSDSFSAAKGSSRRTLHFVSRTVAKALGVKGGDMVGKEKKDEGFV